MFEYFMSLTRVLDTLTIWVAGVTCIIAVCNFYTNRKNTKIQNMDIPIHLILIDSNATKNLPFTIKRKHFTRSEVQGVLGAVFNGKERYDIPFLATQAFSNALEDVQNNQSNLLEITIQDKETFDKFHPLNNKEATNG